MKTKIIISLVCLTLSFGSCSDFLDIVPDGVSQLEHVFNRRSEAKRYLFTCYAFMPKNGDLVSDAGLWGDEFWTLENSSLNFFGHDSFDIARGLQNPNAPLVNHWSHFYTAISECNIFLDNIDKVPDLPDWERKQWIAEVKVLKAYYHFMLVCRYGPIPLGRVNLPIDASKEEVSVFREPVDVCFDYITQLLDESMEDLPKEIINVYEELGRITTPIAASLKAKVLVYAGSPLFNGNKEQNSLANVNGNDHSPLFNQTWSVEKWQKAAEACKEAVYLCEDELGMKLYKYEGNYQYNLSDTIMTQMSLRGAFTERWNSEIIWTNTQSVPTLMQRLSTPLLDPRYQDGAELNQSLAISMKVADEFYTKNGVPVLEDKTRNKNDLYELRTSTAADELYIRKGAKTADIHFDREPRFYAWLGFDTGIWYGQGKEDDKKPDELFYIRGLRGQIHGYRGTDRGPITGYQPKKLVHYKNIQLEGTDRYTIVGFPWPLIRLADLYLLYAEALNEAEDSETNRTLAIKYIDKVRERANLKGVAESWTNYSSIPNKFKTQSGLREIIQQERMIELSMEGQRFWDSRRWKIAPELYKTPIQGWDVIQKESQYYYRKRTVANVSFGQKDYFWPISNAELRRNINLVQNLGWN